MKRLGKILGYLLAAILMLGAMQVQAAGPKAAPKADLEFNHLSTGFPLAGGHATTSCENCHVGGVFVGTPRTCDGCHATGRRVVATPKSTKHIVTDAPCDTCHFNTSTFFGARFNHGTARPGECTNCHNGRIEPGTPSNHPVSTLVGASCDNCHRSSAWVPARWNHSDTASDCSVCHKAGGPGRNYAGGHLPMSMDTVNFTGNCKACHTNYLTFASAYYNHSGASAVCGSCHQNGAYAPGVTQVASTTAHAKYAAASMACNTCHKSFGIGTFASGRFDHTATSGLCQNCHSGTPDYSPEMTKISSTAAHGAYSAAGIGSCGSCHTSTVAWAGSRFSHSGASACATCHDDVAYAAGMTQISTNRAKHTAYVTSGITNCQDCHGTNYITFTGAHYNHTGAGASATCSTCHTGTLGTPPGHIAVVDECGQCHLKTGWLPALGGKPVNHIPYAAGTACLSCHTTPTTTNHGAALHVPYLAGYACTTCHLKNNPYSGNGQSTKSVGHEGMGAGDDCSKSGCHKPLGNRGTAYSRW